MKILAVTSFNAAGRDLYGDRMMASFDTLWPREIVMAVYSEGFDITKGSPGRFENRKLPAWVNAFKARHAHDAKANGLGRGSYDFRWDAVKFSNKVAAEIDACEHTDADAVIWLDGDVITHSPIAMVDLESLVCDDCALSWLDRDGLYPECGFVVYNRRHAATVNLLARWRALYETDALFGLPQWHDSAVLQMLVAQSDISAHSLSGDFGRKTSHPLVNSHISRFLDHQKGRARKQAGRTQKSERKIKDEVPYWA